jgi:hypothetical protein
LTLVLTLLTPRFVAQVSDMKLTDVSNPVAPRTIEERAAKAVVWCNSIVFAYTGPAVLEGKRTDAWLTEVLQPASSLDEAIKTVQSRADTAVELLPANRKKLAIVGVGWSRQPGQRKSLPSLFEITNLPAGRTGCGAWGESPLATFETRYRQLTSEYQLVCHGQPIPLPIWRHVRRLVARSLQANMSPGTSVLHLANAIGAVSSTNNAVGSNLLVSYLPAGPPPSPGGFVVHFGEPTWKGPEYRYLSASASESGVVRMPAFVCGGMAAMGGVMAREDHPELEIDRQPWLPPGASRR